MKFEGKYWSVTDQDYRRRTAEIKQIDLSLTDIQDREKEGIIGNYISIRHPNPNITVKSYGNIQFTFTIDGVEYNIWPWTEEKEIKELEELINNQGANND